MARVRAGKLVGLSAGLGILVLIPVVIVIALGLYGSSLGGPQTADGPAGADLALIPRKGRPGSQITIEGRNWPARSFVSLFLERPLTAAQGRPLKMRLAEIVASRSGNFQIETVVPASLIPSGMSEVYFAAEGYNGRGDLVSASGARFTLEPYASAVRIEVVDSDSGISIADADVDLEDRFGQTIATVVTGPAGRAEFGSIRPGSYVATVRRLDYRRREASFEVLKSGEQTFTVGLSSSPNRRLYLPIAARDPDGLVVLQGIDRSSGLPFQRLVADTPGRYAPIQRPDRSVLYNYLLPSGSDSGTEPDAALAAETLFALGKIGDRILHTNEFPGTVWHVGAVNGAELAFATDSSYAGIPGRSLMSADSATGAITVHSRFPQNVLVPRLSRDLKSVYLVNWVMRSAHRFDLVTGQTETLATQLPRWISDVLVGSSETALYLLVARTGAVYRLDLATRELSEPIAEVPGASRMANMPDGRIALTLRREPSIVIVDSSTGAIVDVIPLAQPTQWLWPDPDGPFIFAGAGDAASGMSVQLIDRKSLKVVDNLKFDPVP